MYIVGFGAYGMNFHSGNIESYEEARAVARALAVKFGTAYLTDKFGRFSDTFDFENGKVTEREKE
jgi:hypothetical protein